MERISSEVLLLCNAYLLAVLELNRIVTDNGILTQNNTVVIESVVQKRAANRRFVSGHTVTRNEKCQNLTLKNKIVITYNGIMEKA